MGKARLPALALPPRQLPKAAREQIDIQAYEGGLTELARVQHPTIAWWHGYRKIGDLFGSYCYVCDRFVVTWSRAWPIPKVAQETIHEHKNEHRAGALPGGTPPKRMRHPQ